MNSINGLLEILDFKKGYVAVDDFNEEKLSAMQRRLIHEVEEQEFRIDGIYFSGDFPTLYFKSVTGFDQSEMNQVCAIHLKIWNQRRVPFLYVESPIELRIYNCFKKPINFNDESKNIDSLEIYRFLKEDSQRLEELIRIFGRISLESGRFWKEKKYAKKMDIEERVDRTLIKKLKETRTSLLEMEIDLKIVHNLLIRSLFILYLEDRKATDPTFYGKYHAGAMSYSDILVDRKATFALFEKLDESFNGNLSPVTEYEKKNVAETHLEKIRDCFWDRLFNYQWRAFDFSIIPIELISEIYEEFLKTETGAEQVSKDGSYYTPLSLVEFILNEKLPWADEENTDYNLKILDPACGSGIFLVEAYRRLVDRWKYCHKSERIGVNNLQDILLNSIFGVEKNLEAVKVAAFSLYLAMLDYLEPKSLWNSVRFPFLVAGVDQIATNRQGRNLFQASSLSEGIYSNQEYDLVVGNPPFKRGGLGKEAYDYLKNLGFAQEYVLAFLHRATQLCPKGEIALVASSKILFNKTGGYQKFRRFLFNGTNVEAVYNFSILRKAKKKHGGQLIPSAVGPVCVIFYRAPKAVASKERILYCAPKSPIKRNMVDGLVIDRSDFKFLPRAECAKGEANIWKVAMWGTERDYEVINKLVNTPSLKKYFDANKDTWYYGLGLHRPDDSSCYVREFADFPLIPTEKIERFYTNEDNLPLLGKDANYRPHDGKIFYPPMVIIKEGQKNKRFCASYIPFKCVYLNAVYGITANFDAKFLKALAAYTNSSFSAYFLFLTASSWGIERERVTLTELLSLPDLIFSVLKPQVEKLAEKVDEIISLKKEMLSKDTTALEKEIDEIIYQALGLSRRERYLIEDTLKYSLDLFQEGENSEAYHRPTGEELENYAKTLCEDINAILQHSETAVWVTIYEVAHYSPLNIAAIRFSNRARTGHVEKISSLSLFSDLLKEIDRYTYEKFSESVYFRKIVKYYHDDTIFIIKPNEKRFWSRSMAMYDADDIVIEVSNA